MKPEDVKIGMECAWTTTGNQRLRVRVLTPPEQLLATGEVAHIRDEFPIRCDVVDLVSGHRDVANVADLEPTDDQN